MQKLSPAVAIKQFMEADKGRVVSMQELVEFKKACTDDEWKAYASQAASTLGVELN
jgi:hypothetical protein